MVSSFNKKYSHFVYEKYSWSFSQGKLTISFCFKLIPALKNVRQINFKPKIIINHVSQKKIENIKKPIFNNLIFHLGMAEIPTYWKSACPPEIVINAGCPDNPDFIKWWKNLLIQGMGQFFYENKIDWRVKNFLSINCQNIEKKQIFKKRLKNRFLVPFSGGRDSIVTIEKLKKNKPIALFMVNPNKEIKKTAALTGVKKQIVINRIIDKKLLELNRKGYLNGHTPFTATLSFLSVFAAVLFNFKNIAFSNEKSSEEGNVKYLGRKINHQWAKSFVFEKMFKKYCQDYLAKKVNYFSYLRDFSDLEISRIFSNYPRYFQFFCSCNSGMKIKRQLKEKWCGNCPKCLFVYASLYPFLGKEKTKKIFNKDVFENKKLLKTMKGLVGKSEIKPFECVGSKKENRLAFSLSLKKAEEEGKIPYLLKKFKEDK
jgi:UDP-N-acetyl-alpha-D-muramoyl-L-alanyl-L-glutamate epimerase